VNHDQKKPRVSRIALPMNQPEMNASMTPESHKVRHNNGRCRTRQRSSSDDCQDDCQSDDGGCNDRRLCRGIHCSYLSSNMIVSSKEKLPCHEGSFHHPSGQYDASLTYGLSDLHQSQRAEGQTDGQYRHGKIRAEVQHDVPACVCEGGQEQYDDT